MKREVFDKKLFLNGLKQLRLVGSIFLILSVLGTAVPTLMMILSNKRINTGNFSVGWTPISMVTIFVAVMMFLAPFGLCLALFSFLNDRRGSDFYHSLPNKRLSLFSSFSAAVYSWTAAVMLLPLLISALIYLLLGVTYSLSLLPYLLLTYLVGSILITSVMLLAMSVTGTLVSNISVFAIVLFLPRFISTVFSYLVVTTLKIIPVCQFNLFTNPKYNIPFDFLLAVKGSANLGVGVTADLFTSRGAIAYTFVLAVLYFVLAGFLFRRRKSETAGKSAPNRLVQHIYRCAVTLPIALMIPFEINMSDTRLSDYWAANSVSIVILAVLTVVVYFLFELITTKKIKNLLRAAPVFLAVIAIALVFGLSVHMTRESVYRETPAASEIKSATVMPMLSTQGKRYSYGSLIAKDIALSDPGLDAVVSASLSDTLKSVKNGVADPQLNALAKIRLKSGKTIERYLHLSTDQLKETFAAEEKSTEYRSALTALPRKKEIQMMGIGLLKDEQTKQLWQTFQGEYATLGFEDQLQLSNYVDTYSSFMTGSTGALNPFNLLFVTGYFGVDQFQTDYPISVKTPKTALLYMQMVNRNYESKLREQLRDVIDGKSTHYSYTVQLLNADFATADGTAKLTVTGKNGESLASSSGKPQTDQAVLSVVQKQMSGPVDLSKPVVSVSFNSYNSFYMIYMNISEENAEAILSYHQTAD